MFGNAGCYGGDVASVLARAWLLINDVVEEWPVERFEYGYRTSALKADGRPKDQTKADSLSNGSRSVIGSDPIVVVAAEFNIQRADPRELAAQMERTAAERKSKTPGGQSCGSVFKNPPARAPGG